jgi:phosphatidylglycerophosphate synthase
MYSLEEIKTRSRRENMEEHARLYYFSVRTAIYLTYVFVNLGLSANFVTGVFFLVGLASAMCILSGGPLQLLVAYVLWRLHALLDIADGEVARFTQRFSKNGAYWDYLTHSFVFPIFFASMGIAQFKRYDDVRFLYVAIAGAIAIGFYDSVKNDYYRALYANGVVKDGHEKTVGENKTKSIFHKAHAILFDIFTVEGLLMSYIVAYFYNDASVTMYALLFYVAVFLLMSVTKIYLFSTRGTYPKRS